MRPLEERREARCRQLGERDLPARFEDLLLRPMTRRRIDRRSTRARRRASMRRAGHVLEIELVGEARMLPRAAAITPLDPFALFDTISRSPTVARCWRTTPSGGGATRDVDAVDGAFVLGDRPCSFSCVASAPASAAFQQIAGLWTEDEASTSPPLDPVGSSRRSPCRDPSPRRPHGPRRIPSSPRTREHAAILRHRSITFAIGVPHVATSRSRAGAPRIVRARK